MNRFQLILGKSKETPRIEPYYRRNNNEAAHLQAKTNCVLTMTVLCKFTHIMQLLVVIDIRLIVNAYNVV